jgi:hypothetical protein
VEGIMPNLLLNDVEYLIEETALGIWRRYLYENGARFDEFKSHARFMGWPVIHYTRGRCPETGSRIVAKGVLAVGRIAVGGLAIGQAAFGLIAVGQLGVGLLFGLAQAATGFVAIGQLALGFQFGLGQFATGVVSIGQFALGKYVLAQVGAGMHVLSTTHSDAAASTFFGPLLRLFTDSVS